MATTPQVTKKSFEMDRLCRRLLLQQLDIETDGNHEEIHVIKALFGHVRRQRLGDTNGVHDTILYGKDQSLLLLRVCVHTKRRKELPHVDIFTGNHSTGEDVR